MNEEDEKLMHVYVRAHRPGTAVDADACCARISIITVTALFNRIAIMPFYD